MDRTKKRDSFIAKTFIANLQKALNTLPSEAEKKEIQSNLASIIEYFSELRRWSDAMPTIEDMNEVKLALEKMTEMSMKAQANPMLASAFGMHIPSSSRVKKEPFTDKENEDAKLAVSVLESLSAEELRSKLYDENLYSIRKLQSIAFVLGVRSTQKLSRESVANLIETKIINYRGYKILRGQADANNSKL